MALVPGSLFRLSNGTTGIVHYRSGDCVYWHDKDGHSNSANSAVIEPFIICEPGHGPIRGQDDTALRDAQARAARLEQKRAACQLELTDALRDRNEAMDKSDALHAEVTTLRCERDAMATKLAAFEHGAVVDLSALYALRDDNARLKQQLDGATASVDTCKKAADEWKASSFKHERQVHEEQNKALALSAKVFRLEHEAVHLNAEVKRLNDALDAMTHSRDALRAEAKLEQEGQDLINQPAHYTATDYEPVVVIEALNPHFHVGTALKYLARAPHKGNLAQDLQKARWYLLRATACGVEPKVHRYGPSIADVWSKHYPEALRESAEDAIDYLLAGNEDRAQLMVLAMLDTLRGDA